MILLVTFHVHYYPCTLVTFRVHYLSPCKCSKYANTCFSFLQSIHTHYKRSCTYYENELRNTRLQYTLRKGVKMCFCTWRAGVNFTSSTETCIMCVGHVLRMVLQGVVRIREPLRNTNRITY